MPLGKAKAEQALKLRLAGMRSGEIAQTLGVSTASVSQTLNDPEFAARLESLNDESCRDLMSRRNEMAMIAASVFQDVATDPTAKHSDRVSAARELADRFGLTKETSQRIVQENAVTVVLDEPSVEATRSRLEKK